MIGRVIDLSRILGIPQIDNRKPLLMAIFDAEMTEILYNNVAHG